MVLQRGWRRILFFVQRGWRCTMPAQRGWRCAMQYFIIYCLTSVPASCRGYGFFLQEALCKGGITYCRLPSFFKSLLKVY